MRRDGVEFRHWGRRRPSVALVAARRQTSSTPASTRCRRGLQYVEFQCVIDGRKGAAKPLATETDHSPWDMLREFAGVKDHEGLRSYVRSLEMSNVMRAILRLEADDQQTVLTTVAPSEAAVVDAVPMVRGWRRQALGHAVACLAEPVARPMCGPARLGRGLVH